MMKNVAHDALFSNEGTKYVYTEKYMGDSETEMRKTQKTLKNSCLPYLLSEKRPFALPSPSRCERQWCNILYPVKQRRDKRAENYRREKSTASPATAAISFYTRHCCLSDMAPPKPPMPTRVC